MQAARNMANESKIEAFQMIHADFKDILKHEKCRSCSCLHTDVLNDVLAKLKAFRKYVSDRRLITIEKDFKRWVKDADFLKMHG